MREWIFTVPVLDRWLVLAPLSGVAALVNRAAVERLRGGEHDGRLAELGQALSEPPAHVPGPRRGPLRPLFLGLIPTRACNLRCVYCGFGARTAPCDQLELRAAVTAVDWMAERAEGTLEVHFFGGEPLAAEDVVDVAVHRTRSAAAQRGLAPRLELATNGACGQERARFLGDYFDAVVLSFDGPPAIHDRRRPRAGGASSFAQVAATARILSHSPTELCLRICVGEDNLSELAATVTWFAQEFEPAVIDFEVLQPTAESAAAGLRPPDPWRFAAEFRRARQAAQAHGVKPVYAAAERDEPRVSFCPVGKDALILSPDGRVSACYLLERDWQARGLDLSFGRLAEGGLDVDLAAVQRVRAMVAAKPRCERCFCRWWCAGGCHVNHTYPGCPPGYDDFCVQTRLITACSLVDELGHSALAEELLANRAGMERLALQASDRLEDWQAASE